MGTRSLNKLTSTTIRQLDYVMTYFIGADKEVHSIHQMLNNFHLSAPNPLFVSLHVFHTCAIPVLTSGEV